jgi:hypothetical protein
VDGGFLYYIALNVTHLTIDRFVLQPNIRRTFPGRSAPAEEEVEDHEVGDANKYEGAGGKSFGKSLRASGEDVEDDDEDSDEDDDDSEEEEEEDSSKPNPQQYTVRGSGKQLASSGKYLRP